jgi:hypothetical protein
MMRPDCLRNGRAIAFRTAMIAAGVPRFSAPIIACLYDVYAGLGLAAGRYSRAGDFGTCLGEAT